jgi:ribonuclease R
MSKKKPKKKNKGFKLSTKDLQAEILRMFKRNPKKRLNPRQISKGLSADNNKDSVQNALDKLVAQKRVKDLGDFKYQYKYPSPAQRGKGQTARGIVDMTRSGAAYIVIEGSKEDVYVPAKYLNGALNGDLVEIVASRQGNRRPEGEVTRVVERATEHFLGTVRLSNRYAFVIPDKQNMPVDIYVDLENTKGAKDGDKVVVRITNWTSTRSRSPEGKVTSVLGAAGSSEIEMKSILINNGFELDFPEEVIDEANNLAAVIDGEEVSDRRDMRSVPTFTIDPEDAKDFDDAISYRRLENGNLEIGVHIADVAYFVKPGSALDEEAYKRSTSVYLVDRVLPMLPEKLSNGLCSLRPNEDKFTFSAVFEFNENDKVIKRWFGRTLTHSDRRFTYEEAQEVMDTGQGDFAEELKEINRIAKKMRKVRFQQGSIDFDMDEVRFRLDEDGVPISVFVKERKDAHMLIEEYMLLANREVATYISRKGQEEEIPFVYRTHDEPDPDKVAQLASFAKELGFEMKVDSPQAIGKAYNSLSKAAEKNPGLKLLEPLAVRTMAKAEYSSDNIGHYGLGFDFYTHFTSPIRRYSDVLVHRLLDLNLNGKTYRTNKKKLEEQCKHISMQERKAMTAERESVKYKQVEFMEKHVGETFEGHVSGIIDRGIFVELSATRCEGMVAFETMTEPFEVAEGRLQARGLRSRKVLKMGDTIQVRIISTDLGRRQIEMELVE